MPACQRAAWSMAWLVETGILSITYAMWLSEVFNLKKDHGIMQAACNNLGARLAQYRFWLIGWNSGIGGNWVQSLFERRAGKGESHLLWHSLSMLFCIWRHFAFIASFPPSGYIAKSLYRYIAIYRWNVSYLHILICRCVASLLSHIIASWYVNMWCLFHRCVAIERCFACVNILVSFALWICSSVSIKKINKKVLTL